MRFKTNRLSLFTDLREFREENKDEFRAWFPINILIPLLTFALPLAFYVTIHFDALLHINHARWSDFKTKVFNGSIPVTTVGMLVFCLFTLVKYDVAWERKFGFQSINMLRKKLVFLVVVLMLFAWGQYYVENFDMPVGPIGLAIFGCSTLMTLIVAIYLSRGIFYMQESIITSSLDIKTPLDLTLGNIQGNRLCKIRKL
jgi:hypothetical protein